NAFDNGLVAVAGSASNDVWAIGSATSPIAEHWDGTSWSLAPLATTQGPSRDWPMFRARVSTGLWGMDRRARLWSIIARYDASRDPRLRSPGRLRSHGWNHGTIIQLTNSHIAVLAHCGDPYLHSVQSGRSEAQPL